MDKFLMICYVAARFSLGDNVFVVTAAQRNVFIEAPAWVKDTLLFKWLLNDGSIKVAEQQISKKKGENDPLEGISAEGKDEKVSEANEQDSADAVEPAEKKPKTRKSTKG